jgi:gamma-glutamylcyclotransferase (GGCT)/AIG2-like uncharacterized protein YtfP
VQSWSKVSPAAAADELERSAIRLIAFMVDFSPTEVNRLVAAANAARWRGNVSGRAEEASEVDAERHLDALFRTSHTLAVYGTLAPGQPNYHVVAPLGGEWTDGLIEGDLFPVGWGATLGFPAFRPRVGGATVAVKVLTAPLLATAWPTLDRFEGPEYRRILVPVFRPGLADERLLYTVANIYAAAGASTGAAGR